MADNDVFISDNFINDLSGLLCITWNHICRKKKKKAGHA